MKLRSLFPIGIISILIMAALPVIPIMAQQPVAVAYGQTVGGAISPTVPTAVFFLQGAAGDLVDLRLITFAPEQDFALSVISPAGQPIGAEGQSELMLRLQETGSFAIQVSSLGAQSGEFLLQIFGTPAGAPLQAIAPNAPITVTFPGAPQVFSITADLSSPQTLAISSADGANFEVLVINNRGQILLSASGLPSIDLALPPAGNGVNAYEVHITPTDGATSGTVQVSLTSGSSSPAPTATLRTDVQQPPVTTPDVIPPGTGACSVSANGVVNVRQGPSTNYFIAGQLLPGVTLPVIGINQDWYAVTFNGVTGWVSAAVVTASGDCSTVPFMSAEGVPAVATTAATQPLTPTTGAPTATYTSTLAADQNAPTATYTPTTEGNVAAPTQTYTSTQIASTITLTPTYTPTVPVATAPPDSNYFLTLPLDSSSSVTDFVSYPEGDTEDRVFYEVTGMNNNVALPGGLAQLTLAVSCFGTGTQNVTFFIAGNTYSCGQTIFNGQITAEQDTGSVLITAVGGENTYVQWVLTGTVTRLN